MKSHPYSYWISTILLSLMMLFSAFAYLTGQATVMDTFASLGYPRYFPVILGVAKLAGVVVLLMPHVARLKEWAYAGFTFTFVGAVCSHLVVGQTAAALLPLIALALLVISYVTRPAARRLLTSGAVQETDEHGHVHTVVRSTEAQ